MQRTARVFLQLDAGSPARWLIAEDSGGQATVCDGQGRLLNDDRLSAGGESLLANGAESRLNAR